MPYQTHNITMQITIEVDIDPTVASPTAIAAKIHENTIEIFDRAMEEGMISAGCDELDEAVGASRFWVTFPTAYAPTAEGTRRTVNGMPVEMRDGRWRLVR